MHLTEPAVFLVASPQLDWEELGSYLDDVHGKAWYDDAIRDFNGENDAAFITEAAGRVCYKSWREGLNPNVTRIRRDQAAYISNIIASGHGSVLEHASFTLLLENVTRVLTHELVRHRAGVSPSQESGRYVRVTDIPVWFPEWAKADEELVSRLMAWLTATEELQAWMTGHFRLDDPLVRFAEKKAKTSFMRRWLPEGRSTQIAVTANARALRHIIVSRTAEGAEEEIRLVAGMIARVMTARQPLLFGDITERAGGTWDTEYRKV